MHVQLPHHIAERAEVDLFRLGVGLEPVGGPRRLFNEPRAVCHVEIGQLDEAFAARHEDQPGPARVVYQEHAAERQIGDEIRILRQALVEAKTHAAQAFPCRPFGRPSLAANVSPMSARLMRPPIGPAGAPAPKARIGTCSRVWSKPL